MKKDKKIKRVKPNRAVALVMCHVLAELQLENLPEAASTSDTTGLWDYTFRYIFKDEPTDPNNDPYYSNYKSGSRDPRWNLLLHDLRGLSSMGLALRFHRLQKVQNLKKAA